jgi:hypothetical protein
VKRREEKRREEKRREEKKNAGTVGQLEYLGLVAEVG